MISITDEIKDFIKSYKCKPDLFLKDDKPKQINLLDLNKDILNIIGDFVKKDNDKEKEKT